MNVSHYNSVLNLVPKKEGTENFWDELKYMIIMNRTVNYEQFSALYNAVALCRTAVVRRQPDIVVMNKYDLEGFDRFEKSLHIPYEQLLQDLYITLLLTKENGKEYAEGSLKFSEVQYKEMHEGIMNKIKIDLKEIAEKYVKNLRVMNAIG
jgi:hypothetical protein